MVEICGLPSRVLGRFKSILRYVTQIKLIIKKNLPIMPCRFSNDFFTQEKFRMLHIEYLTNKCNKKKSGIKLLTNIVLI